MSSGWRGGYVFSQSRERWNAGLERKWVECHFAFFRWGNILSVFLKCDWNSRCLKWSIGLWGVVLTRGGGPEVHTVTQYANGCSFSRAHVIPGVIVMIPFSWQVAHPVPWMTSLSCLIVMTSSWSAKHYKRALSVQEVKFLTHKEDTWEWASATFHPVLLCPSHLEVRNLSDQSCVEHSSRVPSTV